MKYFNVEKLDLKDKPNLKGLMFERLDKVTPELITRLHEEMKRNRMNFTYKIKTKGDKEFQGIYIYIK